MRYTLVYIYLLNLLEYRLDFLTFSLAQPNAETICSVDSFQVAGAVNKIPAICGDNNGQHSIIQVLN
jgi:hypothetical protein